ncbi:MAG: phosphatase PAP2 family protein [bacterium]
MNIFITFAASFLLWFMYAGVIVLWLVDGKIKKEQAVHALFAAASAWILAHVIKALFPTLRPFQVNGGPVEVVFPLTSGGFPSGHSAAAFALAVTIWKHDKKTGLAFLIAAILVGVGRVLANVHYPVDIVGGIVLGVIDALLVEKLHFRKLFKRIDPD